MPFWSNFLFAYMDYDTARRLPTEERFRQSLLAGLKSALAGSTSPTGLFYRSLITR